MRLDYPPTPEATPPPKQGRGRPRIHLLPDPNAPRRKAGRPKGAKDMIERMEKGVVKNKTPEGRKAHHEMKRGVLKAHHGALRGEVNVGQGGQEIPALGSRPSSSSSSFLSSTPSVAWKFTGLVPAFKGLPS